jgi:cobalamin 5'-phosphate synthase/cobalamin synthase
MKNPLGCFARTVSYVTIFPMARLKATATEDEATAHLSGLSAYLPAVGFFLGIILAAVTLGLVYLKCTPLLAASLVVSLWLYLTGGLHFDGLMDTMDGIASHQSRQRIIEIMADSRVGNFAVISGVMVLLIKVAALSCLIERSFFLAILALLISPALGRLIETFSIGAFPYVKEFGKGKIWHTSARYPQDFLVALLYTLAAMGGCVFLAHKFLGAPLLLLALTVAILWAGAILCGLSTVFMLGRKLGGQTGDTYGASIEVAEAGAVLLLALGTGIG